MTVYQTQTDLFITTTTNAIALTLAMELIHCFCVKSQIILHFKVKAPSRVMPKIPFSAFFLQLLAETKMTLCSNVKPCERWENDDKSSWFPSHLLTSRSDENTYEIIHQTTE